MARQPVWMARERPRKMRLSRERITDAAIGLLDAEGVAGFSMRRLAARLDAGAMSLYEYVRGLEDVYDLAVDGVVAEIDLDDGAGTSWRAVLTRQLHQSRQVMRRHPWLPALMAVRPLLGPRFLARAELFYATLASAGLRPPDLTAAVGTLTYYVQGYTAAENTWRDRVRRPGEETDLRRQAQQFIAAAGERYPTLTRHARLDDEDFDGEFQRGLDTILDGIEARIPRGPAATEPW
jgi:AcrR family transcriptional regulator